MEARDLRRLQRQLSLFWVLLLFALFFVLVWPNVAPWLSRGPRGEPRAVTPRGELAPIEQSTVELFEAARPSVVYINTQKRVRSRWSRRVVEVESGTGSGFVWDDAGHVVTNFHVLQQASSAQVVFFDQSSYEATLVGVAAQYDLAVLKIVAPATRLQPVLVGESHDLKVGQSVFAIGNPFGLNHTLTTGVVSARGRTIASPVNTPIDDMIQIDAAINPGNSGGPLLDSAGRVIGVATAIFSPSGASAGVGFAVPIDTVNRVVPQIIAKGHYRTPSLGVRVNEDVSERVVRRLGVEGVLVLEVVTGQGADAAGLRGTGYTRDGSLILGDIIQRVAGQDTPDHDALMRVLETLNAGDEVEVEYLRDGQRRRTRIVLR